MNILSKEYICLTLIDHKTPLPYCTPVGNRITQLYNNFGKTMTDIDAGLFTVLSPNSPFLVTR